MITVSAPLSVASIIPECWHTGIYRRDCEPRRDRASSPGATVMLTRSGYADIAATNVVVVSPTKITCRLPLPSMVETGAWNVVVTNPGGGARR